MIEKRTIMQSRFTSVMIGLFLAFLLTLTVDAQNETSSGSASPKAFEGQKTKQVSPDELKVGDRARIELDSGSQFKGSVVGVRKDRIRLDVSLENMSLSGTLTLDKNDMVRVSVLPELDESTQEQIKEAKKEYLKSLKKSVSKLEDSSNGGSEKKSDEASKSGGEGSGSETSGSTSSSGGDSNGEKMTAKQRELLEKFPENEWNKKRLEEIKNKYGYQRTNREREFLNNWEELKKARSLKEKDKGKQLLKEFPPDEGWDEERYKHIKNAKGTLPGQARPVRTPREQRFLEVYDQWKEALKAKKKREKEKKKKKEKSGEQKSSETEEDQNNDTSGGT